MEDPRGKYIRWSEECVWQPFGSSLVILNPSHSHTELVDPYVSLNETARDIWNWCDGTRTFETIVALIQQEYEGDPDHISANVQSVISQLHQQGLLSYEDVPCVPSELTVSPHDFIMWADTVLWEEVEGKIIVLDNHTGTSYTLPEEATDLWKLLNGQAALLMVLRTLKEKGTINEDMPSARFKLLLKEFIKLGLLTVKDEPW
ncbi:MAG: PqqD family protein [Theionarchaea archaeon]|nr:PqqD family protein [Theionarchaea archaeon]MBU7000947.1 PqqD family protein [Theionarchaea archaeon]MBU7021112.1 PqqD family protein [Theionarchaea archaeon]MBU7033838.1 PqqD family protein [Theionarchaea archaeon]MBU7039894.1 PqqD family protein [Theionarchaea archaeon]